HVTAARNLDLYTDANEARPPVNGLALDPVDSPRLCVNPAPSLSKTLVQYPSKPSTAILVLCLLDQQFKTGYNPADFVEEFVKTKPLDAMIGSVERLLFNDSGHTGWSISNFGFGCLSNDARATGAPF